jgi:hypothetical protein
MEAKFPEAYADLLHTTDLLESHMKDMQVHARASKLERQRAPPKERVRGRRGRDRGFSIQPLLDLRGLADHVCKSGL